MFGQTQADVEAVDDFYQIRDEINQAPRPNSERRSQIVNFYAGRSVLITGASGFIGKVLIEKLLRTCPDIKRIFVLIRPKWNKKPDERLEELLKAPLFDGVREAGAALAERVIVVEGDVTQQNLGLSGQNLLRLSKEVSVIFHSAATVKFDEPLKQSVAINIAGTKNMIDFCRRCPKLAGLVHVSTAYANCNREQIDEHIYPINMDPEKLIQMADWLDLDTLQELKRRLLEDRPNTYTYTKALAEWLIVKSARDLPVVICRPSIVVASEVEPFKGWIDNVNGPTGVILGCSKGLIRTMHAESDFVADLVPVDKVINLVVTLGWFAHINKNQKHLNESAESFTESILSGGPSSAASTSGGDVESLEAASSDQTSTISEAAVALLRANKEAAPVKSSRHQVNLDDERIDRVGSLDLAMRKRCASKQRVNKNKSASSLSLSSSSSPSLSDDDDEDEELSSCGDHLYEDVTGRHHLHPNSHLMANDDGYGSRSSDYANSVSSSVLSSAPSDNKRRHQKGKGGKQRPRIAELGSRQIVTASSTTTLDEAQQATDDLSDNNDTKSQPQRTRLDCTNQSVLDADKDLEQKLKRFRQRTRSKLIEAELPEELADVPVFHCTSGGENPITWGRIQVLVMTALCVFPSIQTYRYPVGSFTNSKRKDDFYRWVSHYIPGYILDFITRLAGGKPVIVKIFNKFDQAANVLKAFTLKQWKFEYQNRIFLMDELMNDEDRRLFNCDLAKLDWDQFTYDYVVGVRKFLLKEPMDNLEQARKNLRFVYYRNLGLQVLFFGSLTYALMASFHSLDFPTHLGPLARFASGIPSSLC